MARTLTLADAPRWEIAPTAGAVVVTAPFRRTSRLSADLAEDIGRRLIEAANVGRAMGDSGPSDGSEG